MSGDSSHNNTDAQIGGTEEKFLLLLMYAPNRQGKLGTGLRGNLWLQKDMFLLSKATPELKDLKFDEHLFGPYSPAVQAMKTQHLNSRTLHQRFENGPMVLTDKGMNIARQVWAKASEYEKNLVTKVKQFLNEMDTWEMISFIYSSYPETTINSDVVDQYQKKRVDAALSLYRRKMVSLERASNIAGKSLEDFEKLLRSKGIARPNSEGSDITEELRQLERIAGC
jgi:predicted HTH domain antitoxin